MSTTMLPNPATSTVSDEARIADAAAVRRLSGLAAIGFAALVITANIVIGMEPPRDATAAEVSDYVRDNRGGMALSVGLFAIATICMLMFTSAFGSRLKSRVTGATGVWAGVGVRSALLIVPMFATVLIPRIALIVGSDEAINDPTTVSLLWRLQMAALSINGLTISGALLGLCIAGSRAGLVQRWLRVWGPIAAGVGILGAATTVAGLEGSPLGLAGLVAFATWMVFLLTTGVRELRAES